MAWIREIFWTILNMSVTAGITILVILAVRAVFRRAPRKYLYVLWLAAALRLVCPWAPESGMSLFNVSLLQPVESAGGAQVWYDPAEAGLPGGNTGEDEAGAGQSHGASAGSPDSEGIQQAERTEAGGTAGAVPSYEPQGQQALGSQSTQQAAGRQNQPQEDWAQQNSSAGAAGQGTVRKMFPGGFTVLCRVWLIGLAVSLLYQILCWIRVRRVTCQAVLLEKNIYECDSIGSPFVMGIMRPKIYIPFRLTGAQREMILLHEQCHIRRRDHLVKLLAVLILSVYWFHPLVWIAFRCMSADMEMSCDEMVLERLGNGGKEDYSRCLMGFAAQRHTAPGILAFGESSVKSRVKNILRFRKRGALFGAAAVIVCAALAVLLLTNGTGQRPSLTYSGESRAGSRGEADWEAHGMGYSLDGRTRTVAFYRELWLDGALADYQLLDVREVGEDAFPGNGSLTLESRNIGAGDAGAEGAGSTAGEDGGWTLEVSLYQTDSEGHTHWQASDRFSLSDNGIDSFMESFRVDEEQEVKNLSAEEDFVLAAVHLGREKDGEVTIHHTPCEELDDRDSAAYSIPMSAGDDINAGELVYRMAVSEKSAEELEKEYSVSPDVRDMLAAKNPYIGDASADGEVLGAVRLGHMGAGEMELQTSEEPYVLMVHFEDEPEDPAVWNIQMRKKAVMILALIDNAGAVEWTHPAENGTETYRWRMDLEQAERVTGVQDIKACAEDLAAFQDLCESAAAMRKNMEIAQAERTEEGWLASDGRVYRYRRTLAGMLPNASYASIMDFLTDDEELSYYDVWMTMLSSQYPAPNADKVCILAVW